MATLSFNCPKCDKVHSRIKPEMAGHKVRCQCGFVFRLGPKSQKQPGIAEDIQRRRALKERKAATKKNVSGIKIAKGNSASSNEPVEPAAPLIPAKPQKEFELAEPPAAKSGLSQNLSSDPLFAEPVGQLNADFAPDPILAHEDDEELIALEEDDEILEPIFPAEPLKQESEIMEAIPILAQPAAPRQRSKPRFKEPIPPAPILDQPLPAEDPLGIDPLGDSMMAGEPLSRPTAPSRPAGRKKKKRTSGQDTLTSNAGPIISLIVAMIAFPVMSVLTLILIGRFFDALGLMRLGSIAPGSSAIQVIDLILTGVNCLVSVAFVVFICISGVTAIMELSQQKLIRWAHRMAAILATAFIVLAILRTLISVMIVMSMISSLESQGVESNSARTVGVVVGMVIGFLLLISVPVAVAITGFVRSKK